MSTQGFRDGLPDFAGGVGAQDGVCFGVWLSTVYSASGALGDSWGISEMCSQDRASSMKDSRFGKVPTSWKKVKSIVDATSLSSSSRR